MNQGLNRIVGSLLLVAATLAAPAAQAQTKEQPVTQAFEQAFFTNSVEVQNSRTIVRGIRELFGTGAGGVFFKRGNYPELNIERDSKLVHQLYLTQMQQQTLSDPTLRVPDLVNPFNSSMMLLPSSRLGTGAELNYERLPLR
jgi:hypothetical protein